MNWKKAGKRTVMGVLLALLVFFVIRSAPFVYYLLISLIIGIGVTEYFMMSPRKWRQGFFFSTLFFSLFFPAYFYFDKLWQLFRFEQVIVLMIVFYAFRVIFAEDENTIRFERLVHSLTPLFLIALMFSYQINIRLYGGGGYGTQELLFFFFAVIIIGDTAAYYFGSLLGRNKLAPSLSPHKTIEGSVASVLGNIATAVFCWLVFFDQLTLPGAIVAAVIIGVSAQVGDLLESLFKRIFDSKDSSNLLIGHGGVLDRIDSLLISSALYYMLMDLFKQI